MNPIRHFLLAIQFFTRIPITGSLANWVGYSSALQAGSTAYFPLVGFLVGSCEAVILLIFQIFLPQLPGAHWVSAFMAVLTSILLTGALHEDGLADLSDGLGGSQTKERALELMKDSRIGAYGAIALIVSLSGRIIFLASLSQVSLWLSVVAIVSANTVSRFFVLIVMNWLSYIGNLEQSKSKSLIINSGSKVLVVGSAWTVALLIVLFLLYPVNILLGGLLSAGIALILIVRTLKKRLTGFNGDALGATQQITELAFYLGALMVVPLG